MDVSPAGTSPPIMAACNTSSIVVVWCYESGSMPLDCLTLPMFVCNLAENQLAATVAIAIAHAITDRSLSSYK